MKLLITSLCQENWHISYLIIQAETLAYSDGIAYTDCGCHIFSDGANTTVMSFACLFLFAVKSFVLLFLIYLPTNNTE